MAWEKRGDSRRYYYKSVRHGDKVRKVYCGKGSAAEIAAQTAEIKRAARTRRTEAWRRVRASYEDAANVVEQLNHETDCIVKAVLIAAGLREYRGEYRRRASRKHEEPHMEASAMRTLNQSPGDAPPPAVDPRPRPHDEQTGGATTQDEREAPAESITFRQLAEQANNGDPGALQRLRKALDESPEVWQRMGDLAAHARLTLIRLIAAGDMLLFESIQRQARDMESQLMGPTATLLERLSVERVVSTWLQLQYADAMCATADGLAQAKFWSQNQDRAHRRHMSAVRQLSTVRELLPGAAQVEPAEGTKAATVGKREVAEEGHEDCREHEMEGNGNGAAAAGCTDQQQSNEHSRGRVNGHTAKPKATNGNGVKVEPSQSSGESNDLDLPDQPNGQPVNRVLRFQDTPLTSAM